MLISFFSQYKIYNCEFRKYILNKVLKNLKMYSKSTVDIKYLDKNVSYSQQCMLFSEYRWKLDRR